MSQLGINVKASPPQKEVVFSYSQSNTLYFCTSCQKSTPFSNKSPLRDTNRWNCFTVTGFNNALRKAMISEDEDIHLLSTGCPNQREQKISCVLKRKQSRLLDWKSTFYLLYFCLLKLMAWKQQILGSFSLWFSPFCLLYIFMASFC